MKLPFILTYIASWLSISAGVYGLFNIAGQNVNPETKRAVSSWLKNLDLTRDTPNWPATFISLFDRVFSERHFSFRCIFRSSIASVSAVVTVGLVFFLLGGELPKNGDFYHFFVAAFIASIVLNFIPDYLSLLETRYLLKMISNKQSVNLTVALLLSDIIATIGIFIFLGLLPLFLVTQPETGLTILEFFKALIPSSRSFEEIAFFAHWMSVYFYSTFFTSVWIWLYVVSGLIFKTLSVSKRGLTFLQKNLNIDEMPIRAMGFVLLVLISFVYAVVGVGLLIKNVVA